MGMGRYLLWGKNLVDYNKLKKLIFIWIICAHITVLNAVYYEPSVQNYSYAFSKDSLCHIRINSLHSSMFIPYDYPLIKKFRNQYNNENGLRYLETIMQRSCKYRYFILDELQKENLPIELLFLPVIESGFYPKATSKSGAVGIWQFMINSIGGYNIRINDWIDERRDPWKTSIAAIQKLKWNYRYYKDWYLALAAYNCGVGALDKAIKKANSDNYWFLAENGFLKQETALYVAKFLAISEILMQSEKYGINWGEPFERNSTEVIFIDKSIDLVLLAEKLEADINTFLELNPSLKFNITPPEGNFGLRVPLEQKEAVENLLKNTSLLVKYYSYKVKSGDTLYALSKHYGVSINTILNYNPKVKAANLKIGQTLQIPAIKTVEAFKRIDNDSNMDFADFYTVKKGDTLWAIALKYNVQVEVLAEKNGMDINAIIPLGKTIKVPNLKNETS